MLRNSVTLWIRAVENDDQEAGQALFDRYFSRVMALARRKLATYPRRVEDEEDIAIKTFYACLARISSSQFPSPSDRDELWRLLVRITERKVCDAMRKHLSAKRGSGRVRGESIFLPRGSDASVAGIVAVPDDGAQHELAVQFAEEYRRLFDLLDDDLRAVATMLLDGLSTAEIAQRTNRTQRTVQRRLRMILDIWAQANVDGPPKNFAA